MIEQVLITTTADTSQAENEYVGLRQEIKLLKTQLDQLEEGTKEYDATFTKLSAKMFEQKERMQALRNSAGDLGQMLGNVSGLAGTISQGFAGATAALSLFGIENENLIRNIQKVQAFESIARTLESFEDAPKRIKALFNNIKGIFGTSKEVIKVDVAGSVSGAATSIDSKPFKDAADSAKTLQSATAATAGSAAAAAGNQSSVTGQLTNQIPLQEQLNMLEKESLNTRKVKIDLLVAESTARLRASVAESNANEELRIQSIARTKDDDDARRKDDEIRTRLHNKVQANQAELNTLREYQATIDNKIAEASNRTVDNITKQNKLVKLLGNVWQSIGGIIKGVGFGLAIAAAIYGITKLVDYFKTLNAKTVEFFNNRAKLNEDLAKSTADAGGKELAMLKVLQTGYNNLAGDKKKQQQFLEDNKDSYKELGIEIDKLPNKEAAFTKAIEDTNKQLLNRAKQMGVINLLMTKYSEQFDLQTKQSLAQQDIYNTFKTKGTFKDIIGVSDEIIQNIAELYARGNRNIDNIVDIVDRNFAAEFTVNENLNTTLKWALKQRSKNLFSTEYLDNVNATAKSLNGVNANISELEKQVGSFDLKQDKATNNAISSVKTYSQLLSDITDLTEGISFQNPIDQEEFRKLEKDFDEFTEKLRLQFIDLVNSTEDQSVIITAFANIQNAILNKRIEFNNQYKKLIIDSAKFEYNETIRSNKEQLSITSDKYSAQIKAIEESLADGTISQTQFIELFNKIQEAVGVSFKTVKEFKKYLKNEFTGSSSNTLQFITDLENQLKAGEITIDEFRTKIEEKYKSKLTPEANGDVVLGNLSVEQFNLIQNILKAWDEYSQKINDIEVKSRDDNRVINNQKLEDAINLNEGLLQIAKDRIKKESDAYELNYLRTITKRPKGFNPFQTGNLTFELERQRLKDIIAYENANQLKLQSDIDTYNEKLKLYDKDTQAYKDAAEAKAKAEMALTESYKIEAEAQKDLQALNQQRFDSIVSSIQSSISEFGSAINSIYDAQETESLDNLKKLLKAKSITQEEYEQQAEALSNKYAKKRQETEIFQGLLAATATSISAFASAMRPDSGLVWPYNLIAAGATSAAAFAAVIAQVATLKSLSVGSTSATVNPTASSTGSGLNYSLNQQAASNEKLLNSLTDTRVYVLESDITGTQATIKEIEEMSTF